MLKRVEVWVYECVCRHCSYTWKTLLDPDTVPCPFCGEWDWDEEALQSAQAPMQAPDDVTNETESARSARIFLIVLTIFLLLMAFWLAQSGPRMEFGIKPSAPPAKRVLRFDDEPAPVQFRAQQFSQKGKTKMVKIALGQTKQADATTGHPNCDVFAIEGDWYIKREGVDVAYGSTANPADDVLNEWEVPTTDGVTKVPISAAPGLYTSYISTGTGDCTGEFGEPGIMAYQFEYEVVCIEKVTITSVETS